MIAHDWHSGHRQLRARIVCEIVYDDDLQGREAGEEKRGGEEGREGPRVRSLRSTYYCVGTHLVGL